MTGPPEKRCVVLFVKFPEKGNVKSRLAKHLDHGLVLHLYESMVLDTLDTLKQCGVPFRICFDPPNALDRVRQWLGDEFAYMPQNGRDLGERMEQAFVRVFSEGADEALLIGSDIPGLSSTVIDQAFQALSFHDAVIGTANDGGYYLIGFRSDTLERDIFHAMAWSTDSVYGKTMERLREKSRTVCILPECVDADTVEDLRTILAAGVGGPRTRQLLQEHRDRIMTGR